MGKRLFGEPEFRKCALGFHPTGRFGKPIEIAAAVEWMCSLRTSFLIGQSLVPGGGFLAGPNPPG
jgi:NAD(P)-dependent dehydrogenase (short-subunit alcohol dehydrogenase family)